jgi:uncharacterized phage protein gp47/JayE
VSFINRTYPDIARDVLTNLTQGVTQEVHRVSYDPNARPVQIPDLVLQRRPVRRVSFVSGFISAANTDDPPVPYVFTLNDYELTPNPQDPEDLSRIRFLPFGKNPAPDTDVLVNYYPRTTDPTVLTDLNVGSVVRTLVEAISKEMALVYEQLNTVYDSAFLETATGSSLERVVALLGYQRFRAGRPVGEVKFTRRAGALGNITIPAGTPITDAADTVRYETVETHDMLAGETTAQVRVRGASERMRPVDAGELTVIQRSVAGLETVINERPTTRASEDEVDQELRARAKAALLASNKGTVDAIRHGLLQLPDVRDVKVTEMPHGVPGEIQVAVSLVHPPATPGALPQVVLDRIEELRPAGIRVVREAAGSVTLQARVQLVLAGSTLPPAQVEQIHQAARRTLVAEVQKKGVGEKLRVRPLTAALLADQRVVDAALTLSVKGGTQGEPGTDFQPEPGATVQLVAEDVAFATDAFDQPPLVAGQEIRVEVRAVMRAQLLPGVPVDQGKPLIEAKLSDFFTRLTAGASVDVAGLLTALRDDAKYAIDPLQLRVTLTSEDQFFQIVHGGPAFQVQPRQVFTVVAVEVTA